jgi:hypothetical protein
MARMIVRLLKLYIGYRVLRRGSGALLRPAGRLTVWTLLGSLLRMLRQRR